MTLPRPPRVSFQPTHLDAGAIQEVAAFLPVRNFHYHTSAIVRFALHFTRRAIVRSHANPELAELRELTRINTTNLKAYR